ncbi:MAG: DUF2889 domain-containing protein [Peptococcaceae bacterium]|jgi:hypothetical protein|nr:DUF2889 domain-containing protein [Peptococcaceae bacterium]MDH7524385.1 DUF2889 domain-containing protein [Peptococcaceae bacterium]
MYLYNRMKNYSVEQVGNDLRIQASMIDSIHEMVLELVVGLDDSVIKKVRFDMIRTPHLLICKEMEAKARTLEGCAVGQGIAKTIKERVGGGEGCHHLVDLFVEAIKVFKQGQYRLIYHRENDRERRKEIYWSELKGTCFYYTHGQEEKYKGLD